MPRPLIVAVAVATLTVGTLLKWLRSARRAALLTRPLLALPAKRQTIGRRITAPLAATLAAAVALTAAGKLLAGPAGARTAV